MAILGQPALPGIWNFQINDVQALETGGIAPGAIVNAGNNFQLVTTIANEDFLSVILVGASGSVTYNLERQEDNTVVTLASTPFIVPAGTPFMVNSASFTSGPGNDLEAGTYVVTSSINMSAPFSTVVTAFCQSFIKVI